MKAASGRSVRGSFAVLAGGAALIASCGRIDYGPAALDCQPSVPLEQRDTDGDGVLDLDDDDDDGDGLSDAVECGWSATPNLVSNGSFESPVVEPPNVFWSFAGSEVPGWAPVNGGIVEIWTSGYEDVPAADGNQLAELQTDIADGLRQDLATPEPVLLRWAFRHRGRLGLDTVELTFGPPGGAPDFQRRLTSDRGAWTLHAGEYQVPAGQTTTRMQLLAVDWTDPTKGNFIDSVSVEPVCAVDRDNDGCSDSEDLDSNGDGIPDAER